MSPDVHRGVIHFHTRHSYDCMSRPRRLLREADRLGVSFLVVTDHETIEGALDVRRQADRMGMDIEIPVAAEYHTEYGDVIAAFIEKEITTRSFEELIEQVNRQGGVTMLPHPYAGHREVEFLAARVDMIETFNSRQSEVDDSRAEELARTYGKPAFCSPDSHLVKNLGSAVVTVPRVRGLREDLLQQPVTCLTRRKTSLTDIYRQCLIRALKNREYDKLLTAPFHLARKLRGKGESS